MLRFLTAGESHGQGLVIIVEGLPAGLHVDVDRMTADLRQRQGGYGRGRRMAIESDRAEILSGVRRGVTTGAPVSMLIRNRDWTNWQATMHVEPEMPEGATGARRAPVVRPRPGHADLAGVLKYDLSDIRDVLERASARETARPVCSASIDAWRSAARESARSLEIRPPIMSNTAALSSTEKPPAEIRASEERTIFCS